MNRQDVVAATREALAAAEAQAAHMERLRVRLQALLPAKADAVRTDEDVERLQAFLRFFEQLYDVIGRRLFRGAIALVDEGVQLLSAKALALRLEQLGAIESRADWLLLGEVRNALVHDYAVTPEAFANQLNMADASLDRLLANLRQIGVFLRDEGLFQ